MSTYSKLYATNRGLHNNSRTSQMTEKQRNYLKSLQANYKIRIVWESIKTSSSASLKINTILRAIKDGRVQPRRN